MFITRKGKTVEVPGRQPEVNEKAPEFQLYDANDQVVSLSTLAGQPVIISVIPDINTRVCALQTKRFNEEASRLDHVHFLTISINTKEEQATWCGQEGVEMTMLHDPEKTLNEGYHLLMPSLGLYARAIFVLDQDGIIRHREIVSEMSNEPDYEQALSVAKALRD